MKLYKIYQIEVGVLLSKENPEYNSYNCAWDYKHGYYDEEFAFYKNYDEAKDYLKKYITDGVKNTYGILSEICVDEEVYKSIDENVEDMNYDIENVIYSAYKDDKNKFIENFVDVKNHNIQNDKFEEEECI